MIELITMSGCNPRRTEAGGQRRPEPTLPHMNGDGRADALCFIYEDGVYVGLSFQ